MEWLIDCIQKAVKDTEEDVADYTCGVGGERVKSWSGKEKTFKKSIQNEKLFACLSGYEYGGEKLFQQMNMVVKTGLAYLGN